MGAVKRMMMEERELAFAARVKELMEQNPDMQEHEAGELAAEEEAAADEMATEMMQPLPNFLLQDDEEDS